MVTKVWPEVFFVVALENSMLEGKAPSVLWLNTDGCYGHFDQVFWMQFPVSSLKFVASWAINKMIKREDNFWFSKTSQRVALFQVLYSRKALYLLQFPLHGKLQSRVFTRRWYCIFCQFIFWSYTRIKLIWLVTHMSWNTFTSFNNVLKQYLQVQYSKPRQNGKLLIRVVYWKLEWFQIGCWKGPPWWPFLRTYSTSFCVWHWSNSAAANVPNFCRIS